MKGFNIQAAVDQYVFDHINIDDDELTGYLQSEVAKKAFVARRFLSEMRGNPVEVATVMKWLQGLPSTMVIAFTNYEIWGLLREWGAIKFDPFEEPLTYSREMQLIRAVDNYWCRCACAVMVWVKNEIKESK